MTDIDFEVELPLPSTAVTVICTDTCWLAGTVWYGYGPKVVEPEPMLRSSWWLPTVHVARTDATPEGSEADACREDDFALPVQRP